MAQKRKNLTVAAMKREDAKFNERKLIDVHGYDVYIDKKFRQTKADALVAEFVKNMDELQKEGINIQAYDFRFYGFLLMVKHFTSINIPDKLDEQLKILEIMIDNDFIWPIIDAFDNDEVRKMNEKLAEHAKEMERIVDELNDALRELAVAGELENPDILVPGDTDEQEA